MNSSLGDLFDDRKSPSETEGRPSSRQSQLGQYFTPDSIASFMAGMFSVLPPKVSLLDPGAGNGILTAAFIAKARVNGFDGTIRVDAYEKDAHIFSELDDRLKALDGPLIETSLRPGDFIQSAATSIKLGRGERYSHVIMNPPYMKIGIGSDTRTYLRAIGLETVNMYSGFVGLALELLDDGGELVAIIPRSFCNGPYYQPFRRFLFERAAILHIHLFESRKKAFKSDGVLQENIIIHLKRAASQGAVKISTSADGTFSDYEEAAIDFSRIVYPDDKEQFIHIPTGEADDFLASQVFSHKLKDLGLFVSTGPVVDFRMRDEMCEPGKAHAVPLLYPSHFVDNELVWPKDDFKKSNAIRKNAKTEKWLFPSGFYSVVRRFSSKEERRRIVANFVDPSKLPKGDAIGFENHLNVIHLGRKPLTEDIARGITVFLNSTVVDRYFRRFNGHTQVNATDLRFMPFPSLNAINDLGRWSKHEGQLSQEQIDKKIDNLV